jgi:hypothetical protein
MAHPVQLLVEPPAQIPRVEMIIRLALLAALSILGYSSLYWCLYLALPAIVALVVTKKGGALYLAEDAPRVVRALRWFATAYAYLGLLSNELPTSEQCRVDLQIETNGTPTAGSALGRLVTSLPALVLVAVLSLAATLVWLAAAVMVLVTERVPGVLAQYLALTLRVQLRFAAYHLSLVDRYPSLETSGETSAPR